ncbi:C-X-C chemokine receptor type 3 [Vipera latastei]
MSFNYSEEFMDYYNDSYFYDCCIAQPCDLNSYQNFSKEVLPPFYTLIFLLGLGGNLMVIAVLLLDRVPLLGTDIFILNLAIADILLVFTLPFWTAQAVLGWIFKDFLCKVIGSILKVNFYTSILFLICISFERYLSIVYVIRMYNRNKRFLIVYTTLLVWLVGFLLTVPDFMYLRAEFDSRLNITSCTLAFPPHSSKTWRIALIVIDQLVAFLLPLMAMIYCYTHIILTLLRSRGFQKHKALKVILVVVVAFFLCWSPYHLVQFISTLLQLGLLKEDCQWEALEFADNVTTNLGFFHCCLNPLLYAFVGVKFRNKLLTVLRRFGCINQNFLKKHSRSFSQQRDSSWSESTECSYAAF